MKKLFDLFMLVLVSPLLVLMLAAYLFCFLFIAAVIFLMILPALVVKALLHNNSIYDASNITIASIKVG